MKITNAKIEELKNLLSDLRVRYKELNEDIEWGGLIESYPKASEVFRMLETMENVLNGLEA